MSRSISTFNQVGAGLLVGSVISFFVTYIAFQAVLFRQGAESLGVSFFGFSYFFGGFVISVIFWKFSKDRSSAKFLMLFGIAVVAVGSIGLGNLVADPNPGVIIDAQRNADGMARLAARLFFWGVPAIGVLFYGVAVLDAQPNKSE